MIFDMQATTDKVGVTQFPGWSYCTRPKEDGVPAACDSTLQASSANNVTITGSYDCGCQ